MSTIIIIAAIAVLVVTVAFRIVCSKNKNKLYLGLKWLTLVISVGMVILMCIDHGFLDNSGTLIWSFFWLPGRLNNISKFGDYNDRRDEANIGSCFWGLLFFPVIVLNYYIIGDFAGEMCAIFVFLLIQLGYASDYERNSYTCY